MSPTPFINSTSFPAATFGSLSTLLNLIIPLLMTGAGLLFVFLLIMAGWLYMNSDGNAENLKKVKYLIVYAFIGIAIVLVSYLAVKLVGQIFNVQDLPF